MNSFTLPYPSGKRNGDESRRMSNAGHQLIVEFRVVTVSPGIRYEP